MRRVSSVLLQAVESASIALTTLLLTLVPALVAYAVGGFAMPLAVPWRIAVDAWMLGHGVDVGITLGDAAVAVVGTDTASAPFVLGVGAWGIGLVTILLAVRSGMRLMRTSQPAWAVAGGTVATAGLGLVLGLSAQHESAAPNLVHAAIAPAVCMLLGLTIGALWELRDAVGDAADWLAVDADAAALVRAALRAGVATVAAFVGLGAVLLAVALVVRQADVILLFEALQPDHLGVIALWLVQLAVLPTAVIWSTSWMLGPGFALGAGSSVSPLGTDLGPVPTLPLLGAIAPGVQPWALIVTVLPLAAAVGIGALVRQRTVVAHWWQPVVVAAGGGLVAGLVLAVLAAAASGGIGPGRLDVAGPTWWLVGAVGSGLAAVGLAVGLLAGGVSTIDASTDEDADAGDVALDASALAAAARARHARPSSTVDDEHRATRMRDEPVDDARELPVVPPASAPADADAQETAPIAPPVDEGPAPRASDRR